ncbi:MAG: hypothetical protein ACOX2F_02400 [bacterium]
MSKIKSIKFNNYRAFYGNFPEITLDRKNLLVWGENGSGKSSFCKAIHDFVFNKTNDYHQKNKFSENNWSVEFNVADANYIFEPTSAMIDTSIKNCALVSPFLDYRKILSLYFSPDSENKEINLFKLFEKLLAEFPITEKDGRKLKELKAEQDYKDVFSNLLNDYLKDEIVNIIKEFKLNFNIESFVFEEEKITIKASVFGEQIEERYHEFLNEARLSALSISVYLAAIKKLLALQTDILNILVLDDILIGLDMGNRLAVFDIIKNHFSNTQIFFFTYDKAWFEVFRDKVDETRWISLEMFAQSVSENGKEFEKPFIREKHDCWMKAIAALENFDYDNCGNLLRKELEKQLDKYLAISDGNLEQKILLANLKEREKEISETLNALLTKIDKIKAEVTDQSLLGKINSIESSVKDIQEAEKNKKFAYLKEIKNALLNPASHNQTLKPLYKQELEKALDTIVKFMENNNIEIDLSSNREKVVKTIRESVLKDTGEKKPTKLLTQEDLDRLRNFDKEVDDDFQ